MCQAPLRVVKKSDQDPSFSELTLGDGETDRK